MRQGCRDYWNWLIASSRQMTHIFDVKNSAVKCSAFLLVYCVLCVFCVSHSHSRPLLRATLNLLPFCLSFLSWGITGSRRPHFVKSRQSWTSGPMSPCKAFIFVWHDLARCPYPKLNIPKLTWFRGLQTLPVFSPSRALLYQTESRLVGGLIERIQ